MDLPTAPVELMEAVTNRIAWENQGEPVKAKAAFDYTICLLKRILG